MSVDAPSSAPSGAPAPGLSPGPVRGPGRPFTGRPAHAPADHPAVAVGKIGVVLANLGTPPSTQTGAIKRYLRQFLTDRRVIEIPQAVWRPILELIILNTRPPKTARAYAEIWDREHDASPLKVITQAQADALRARLDPGQERIVTAYAMRYGEPSIGRVIAELKEQGCERILLAPLYPQYSASTNASAADAAFDALKGMRWQPALRIMPPYFDDPAYIAALAADLRGHLASLDWEPDVILASFHGLPQSYFRKGDPYHCHCAKTARLLREAMGLDERRLRLTFQSRFGPAKWLEPYTDKTLEALPKEGVKRVVVVTPGFSADCIETLEEIALGGRETFMEAGGEHFSAAPCLNASHGSIDMIEQLVRREAAGWL